MMGRARVAPLKNITIPRMELTAAMLSVKVDKMLRAELQLLLENSVFWTDSQAVIKYIANEHTRFHTFIANRVSTIRDNTKVSQWKYVETKLNPADDASRGLSAGRLVDGKRWIQGPTFLLRPMSEWPSATLKSHALNPDDPEVKVRLVVHNIVLKETENPTNQLLSYFSCWLKLRKAVAWILKLKGILQSLVKQRKEKESCVNRPYTRSQSKVTHSQQMGRKAISEQHINIDDLETAEKCIICFCQRQIFPEEMTRLEMAPSGVKRSSPLYKLDPVMEDGILRVGGRLDRSAMPQKSKHPIILSKNMHISSLILRQIHENVGHNGRNHVLSQLRQKYWITGANAAVRKIISKCVECRRVRGRPGEQKMAGLPVERLIPDNPPFTNVGLDYFGPIEVKKARSLVKRYGVIFTCMSSRAVHLEVAHSLDTDSCINAIRRFISRRGQVEHLRSDNGTNLVGAERELKKALLTLNQHQVKDSLLQHGVKWSFNPPAASHHGGVWERLIRMVRCILCSVLHQQTLDDEGLCTVFCEVEAILNSRPITTVSADRHDLEALTPNHILLLNTKPALPPGLFQKSDLYARRRWKQIQYIAELFWKRWTKEYLPLLQERQKWCAVRRNFQVGDVVMIVDSTAPRGSWLLARIKETIADSKGLVRSVKLQTRTSVLERPITKICLLLETED